MKIFILTGPTASGKTAIAEYLLLKDTDMLAPLVSFTTRAKLSQETQGRDYYFINEENYLDLKINGQIAQEIEYLNYHYGLQKSELIKLEQSKKNGLVVMGMSGVKALKRSFGDQNVVSLFVYRDLSEIQQELNQREIPEAEKTKRFELAKEEMLEISYADYVIYNIGSLNDAYKEAIRSIHNEINSDSQKTIQSGMEYKDAEGNVYEALEIIYHHTSWQSMVLYKEEVSGLLISKPLSQFFKSMVAM